MAKRGRTGSTARVGHRTKFAVPAYGEQSDDNSAVMASRRPRGRRRWAFAGAAVAGLVVLSAMIAALRSDRIQEILVAPADITPVGTPSLRMSAEEQAFYDAVAPRLARLTAEVHALAELGRSKNRNLIEIRTRGDRVNEISAEIDAFAQANGVPARFSPAFASYREGVAAMRRGMDLAWSAFTSLDFDRIPAAVEQFNKGTAALDEARLLLEGGDSRPAATPAPTGE